MPSCRIIVATLAALLVGAAPAAGATLRIVNGASPSQPWPAQTSVRFTVGATSYVCGGTLVSARWVLTAGHCATDDDGGPLAPSAFALRIGSTSRSSGGYVSAVDQVVRHASYSDATTPHFDLALLHLAGTAPQEPLRMIGGAVADAALWSAGTQATIIGWGVTETGSTSPTLLEAQVPMVGDGSCSAVWGVYFSAASMVCAGGAATDTCNGDSGGPLMVRRGDAHVLVGVTSWGSSPCAEIGLPGVYARLGDAAINAWVTGIVPTVSLAPSTTTPEIDEPVALTATTGAAPGTPTLEWDTDGDGAFDDGSGPTASVALATAGAHAVAVQALYPDGDRAIARETLTVPGAPPVVAPPPPPPPPAPPVTTSPPPAAGPEPAVVLGPVPVAPAIVSAPRRIRFATLRVKGLRVRVTCARACSLRARLTLGAATARRFGLGDGRRAVTIGTAAATLPATGTRTIRVRLAARAARALRDRARATAELRTELIAGAARSTTRSSVGLRR